MFKPLSLFVGLRYSLTRKRNLILSFVSLISMLGICLGVLILIVALAVINGSISTLRVEALKSVPHVTVSGALVTEDWAAQRLRALRNDAVLAAAPYVEGEALLRYQGVDGFIRLRGVDAALEADVVSNANPRYRELLELLATTDNGIILGTQLAGSLGIYTSGEVSVTALRSLLSRSLSAARGFTVVGFADFGFYGNDLIALVNLEQAQELFVGDNGAMLQLRLKVVDEFAAAEIAAAAFDNDRTLSIQPWNVAQANLFNALNMEKILTGFMLMMIVVIGAVNIVSTLVMAVSDKSADIAILRTMGASKQMIMQIFIVQGLVAGVIGTIVGATLGVLLAYTVTDLSLLLETLINSIFTDANIYFISHLRTSVDPGEVMLVCAVALVISFIATLYPAYRASKIQPAEVLRYE
ncbi:MAG: FtsX-like permease family protein [Gammaproteobacteria bacterium]|nr:FtsX-like permease family protein [Gammaproteobacteria bacterium]